VDDELNWPKQSQGSIGIDIYINDQGYGDTLALAASLQAFQLMEEPEKALLHLGLEAKKTLGMVAIPQSQLPAEGGENGR